MTLRFLICQSKKEPWVEAAKELFTKKLQAFIAFEIVELKAAKFARDSRQVTVQLTDEAMLKTISPSDVVILFDENGKDWGSSVAFASQLQRHLESGKSRLVFVIGGAYGLGPQMRARAQASLRLSGFTMSHHVAVTVALEQVYRAFTLIKHIPYHNE